MFNAQDPSLIMKAAYKLKIKLSSLRHDWFLYFVQFPFLALPLNLFLANLSGRALYYVVIDTFYTRLANSVGQIVSTYLYNIHKIKWF